jgi:hypothetical protein
MQQVAVAAHSPIPLGAPFGRGRQILPGHVDPSHFADPRGRAVFHHSLRVELGTFFA